jgi:hypothetical protein
MPYVRPQVEVFQEFTQAPQAIVQNLNAFIFGPNYRLFRYAEADERELIIAGDYDKDAGNDVDYPNQPAGTIVDEDYVKVFSEDTLLRYATLPEDSAAPLVVVGPAERNRLRAAPIIGAVTEVTTGPTITSGGYHTGGVSLPESYYLFPKATFDLGTVAGEYSYVTTEGLSGSFDVAANATAANEVVAGPDGIALDFDTAGVVQSPLVVTFTDNLGGTFTLTGKTSRLAAQADFAIAAAALRVNIDVAAGALAGSYDNVTHILTLAVAPGDDLASVRTALLSGLAAGQADFLVEFDVSAITGTGLGTAVTAADQDANNVGTVVNIDMIPVVHRILVNENAWVFQTKNGFARSPQFLRDVLVGDRIRWNVTSVAEGTSEERWAKIVGFEADLSNPVLGDAVENGNNQDSQAGDDASAGLATIVAGGDNQRDFNGAATALFSVSTLSDYVHGDYTRGILEQGITIEITKSGLAGVAEATVSNASGTYHRTGVLIEATGANDGQIYVGNNIYFNFEVGGGDADAVFKSGDTYAVESLAAPYVEVLGSALEVDGQYTGAGDTVYNVQVTRGGVFDRVAFTDPGLTVTAGITLTLDLATWAGGDVDDEYILECTSGGDITTAQFKLTSQLGEIQAGITFAGLGVANQRVLGSKGLQGYLDGGAATFVVGEYWIGNVRASRPYVRVQDTAGIDQTVSSVVNDGDAINIGLNGGTLTIPANSNTLGGLAATGGLVLGERWTVAAAATKEGAVQTLIVSSDVFEDAATGKDENGDSTFTQDLLALDLFLVQNVTEIPAEQRDPSFAPGSYNWENDDTGVSVSPGITLQDASWVDGLGNMPYLEMWAGALFTEYRALLQEYTGAIYSISDISQVALQLGTVHPDNPLAQGVYKALENSGQPAVYFMGTPTDDLDGYSRVLDRATLTSDTYGLVPLTLDRDVIGLVEGHIGNMSTEEEKKWRVGFVATETPTEKVIADSTTNPGNVNWEATIKDDPTAAGTQYTRVELTEDADLLATLSPGDKLLYAFSTDAWGNQVNLEATVASVETDKIFYLTEDIGGEVVPAQKIELYHPLTTQEIAEEIRDISGSFGNRRMYHVFPSQLGAFGVTLSGEYGAAAVAGLCSSVVPQQGLTNIAINGFDDIPLVYSTFTAAQLDVIASGGTFIIMQGQVGGEIFVRHQISTAYQDGNLLTSELSITKNLDSISYFLGGELEPYIGVYNVTPELVIQLRTVVQSSLNYLGSSFGGGGLLGPQLILEGTEITNIQQHPVLKDRILINVTLNLPVPLNNIELHLVV